ncbi:MAG: hypothetical protein ACREAA_07905 [Candidatus Polarisedimenticolia bacterium]
MKRVTGAWIVMWALVAAAGTALGQPPPGPPHDLPPPSRPPEDPNAEPGPPESPTDGPAQLADCEMSFELRGWSAENLAAVGDGVITCDNGQTRHVNLKIRGGTLTFSKDRVVEGTARFSKVKDIGKLFGQYDAGAAHAGTGPASGNQVFTKGGVSMTLTRTGEGADMGVDFSRFVVQPADETKQERKARKQKEKQGA